MSSPRQRGFTLIEVIVVVAIIAILASFAIPAFIDIVRNNRIVRSTNDFLSTLHIARSEAITRNRPVSVCRSNAAQTACETTAGSWRNGALVFTDSADSGTAGVVDAGEEIIITGEPLSGDFELYSADFPIFVNFNTTGRAGLPAGSDFGTWRLCEPGNTAVLRAILVNRTGRPRVADGTGACP